MSGGAEDGVPVVVAGAEGKSQQLCKVCGDRASGKHYGVISCDGCRGFFKRAIRKKMGRLYRCKDNNSCIVDVSRRNQCQACRYRRCMEVKMNPNAVQKERSPRPPRDDSHVPTAIVTPEIGSVYPHLLQSCPPNIFCSYPSTPYTYPPQVYYASSSLYPRLAAIQYQQHPGFSLALANSLPLQGHVVPQVALAKAEKAMQESVRDGEEKEDKNPVKKERKVAAIVEDYSMDEGQDDQESEKENHRASAKSPASGSSSVSSEHVTSTLVERSSFSKEHLSFSALSSPLPLSMSRSPDLGGKSLPAVRGGQGSSSSPSKKTKTPCGSAFVVPVGQSSSASLNSSSASTMSSVPSPPPPASSSTKAKPSLFKSVTSATATPPLPVVVPSSPTSGFSTNSSAPGVAGPGELSFPAGHSLFSSAHKSSLPLSLPLHLPFPGFLQLAASSCVSSSSSVHSTAPATSPAHSHAQAALPSATSGSAFLDSSAAAAAVTAAAAAAAAAPLPGSSRLIPVPATLTQTHSTMAWPQLPAASSWSSTLSSNNWPSNTWPSSAWPPALPHLNEKDEVQLVTHALQAVQTNIRWVAGLPSFAELSRRDQLVLLEQSWSELLLLSALQGQLCHELVFLTSLSGLQNKETLTVELMNITSRAHALSIDGEELSLLKCLALFRPERRGLVDTRTVEAIQENATVMLNQHVQSVVPPLHAPGLRHTKLLLLLSDIQHLQPAALAAALFRRLPHALPVELFVCNVFTMALDRR